MVNLFYTIDILLLIFIIFFAKRSYENKSYLKIFEYFKIFFAITISAKLSSFTAVWLQKLYITKADTYTTLILISFVVNLAIIYFSWKGIFRFLNKYISNINFRKYLAYLTTIVEVLIITTFSLYIFMQIYITKIYLHKYLNKSFTYPKIERFYNSFLNDDFVNMVLNSDTGTNHKEVIFKSFKNSL